ncbi:hypothetical protein OCS_00591 [Ophiocordyceps sinensis CO18]|uniref:Uncharacterized protein n=1 Tax=Ophiocordyceps sinensis (strain Co18 / CGMCC 3.14243) TaxID=911162 RepID=T5AMS1_OPHSC|nr:hypothetical protein OCS_00591 [Ophiocordyceps sinensis CO18]
MSTYFVPGVAPLREALRLASMIPNLRQAEQDAFPTPRHKAGEDYPELTERLDYWVQPQGNLGKLLKESTDTALEAHLTKMLSTSFGKDASSTKWLGPCEVRKYGLINPKLLFKDLVKRESVRQWLKDAIEDGVGNVYTVLDATTVQGLKQSSKSNVKGEVPAVDIVTHGATALIPGVLDLDVGGSVKRERSHAEADASYMEGERVYAFCYRRINFSIFTLGNKAASARLQHENCWALTADNRGQDDGEDDEGVEVELAENEEAGEDRFEIPGAAENE